MPSDKTYEEKVIRITEIAGEEGLIEGFEFYGCDIKGPAVLIMQGRGEIGHSHFTADPEAMLWEIPTTRTRVVGAVLVKDSRFLNCTFYNIGFAGPPEFIQTFRKGSGVVG